MADNNAVAYTLAAAACAIGLGALIYGAHKHSEDLDDAWQAYLESRKLDLSTHDSHSLIPQEPLASAVPESANFTFLSATPNSTTAPAISLLAQENGLPLGNDTSYGDGSIHINFNISGQNFLLLAAAVFALSFIAALLFNYLVGYIERRVLRVEREQDEEEAEILKLACFEIRLLRQRIQELEAGPVDDLFPAEEISTASVAPPTDDILPAKTDVSTQRGLDFITKADIKADKAAEPTRRHIIHIHELQMEVTENLLMEYLETVAGTVSRRPILQPKDGLNKFGAVVYFEDPGSCAKALKMDGAPYRFEMLVQESNEETAAKSAADSLVAANAIIDTDFENGGQEDEIANDEQKLDHDEESSPLESRIATIRTMADEQKVDQVEISSPRDSQAGDITTPVLEEEIAQASTEYEVSLSTCSCHPMAWDEEEFDDVDYDEEPSELQKRSSMTITESNLTGRVVREEDNGELELIANAAVSPILEEEIVQPSTHYESTFSIYTGHPMAWDEEEFGDADYDEPASELEKRPPMTMPTSSTTESSFTVQVVKEEDGGKPVLPTNAAATSLLDEEFVQTSADLPLGDGDGDADDFHGAGGGARQAAVTAASLTTGVQPVEQANPTPAAEVKIGTVLEAPTNANGASSDIAAVPANVPRHTSAQKIGSETQSKPLSTAGATEPTPAPTPTVPQPAIPARHNGASLATPSRIAAFSPVAASFTPRPGAPISKPVPVTNNIKIATPILRGVTNPITPGVAKQEPQQSRTPQAIQHATSTSAVGLAASQWASNPPSDAGRRPPQPSASTPPPDAGRRPPQPSASAVGLAASQWASTPSSNAGRPSPQPSASVPSTSIPAPETQTESTATRRYPNCGGGKKIFNNENAKNMEKQTEESSSKKSRRLTS